MSKQVDLIAGAGLFDAPRKSKLPAKLDFLQSASGLILALFMWGHMFFVSSILISKDAMWTITKLFEGYFFFGEARPWFVSIVVGVIFALFIGHAGLALRKFPANYRQYRSFIAHKNMMHHDDTNLWFVQLYTGFAMFFLGSVHLYWMFMNPGLIGPYESADRVYSLGFWPLYLVLLFAVEFHGGIGLYRLAVKWGWFEGKNPNQTRANLKKLKWGLTIFFLTLGLLTLGAYIKIGFDHRDRVGERFVPTWLQQDANKAGEVR